jgi:hypothetical protein
MSDQTQTQPMPKTPKTEPSAPPAEWESLCGMWNDFRQRRKVTTARHDSEEGAPYADLGSKILNEYLNHRLTGEVPAELKRTTRTILERMSSPQVIERTNPTTGKVVSRYEAAVAPIAKGPDGRNYYLFIHPFEWRNPNHYNTPTSLHPGAPAGEIGVEAVPPPQPMATV